MVHVKTARKMDVKTFQYIETMDHYMLTMNCRHFIIVLCFFPLVFQDRVSLCSPGYPGTHSLDQAGFELRNPPVSASQVLELKACATIAWHHCAFMWHQNNKKALGSGDTSL